MPTQAVGPKQNTNPAVAGVGVGLLAGGTVFGVKYRSGSKKVEAILADTLDLSKKGNVKYANKIENGFGGKVADLKETAAALGEKAKELKIGKKGSKAWKDAPLEVRQAKNLADRNAKQAHYNLQDTIKEVGKKINLKSAAIWGGVALAVTAVAVGIAAKNSNDKKAKEPQ